MTEQIICAVAKAINKELNHNNEYAIYTERVEQGLKTPCFFILCRNYSDELYRGKRYKAGADFSIEYAAECTAENINSAANSIIEKLYDITEVISTDEGELRGIERKVEKNDKGFVFSVRYQYFYYKNKDAENMEVLKEDVYV